MNVEVNDVPSEAEVSLLVAVLAKMVMTSCVAEEESYDTSTAVHQAI